MFGTIAGMVAHRTVPDHGTRNRYQHRSLACHCADCRLANTAYIARYRKAQRGEYIPRWTEQRLPGV